MPLHLTMRGKIIPIILPIVFVFLSIFLFQASTASAVVIYNEGVDEFLVIPSALAQTGPAIHIATPLDNEQIYSNSVYVSGTMENAANVKVNGIEATVSGNAFRANLTLTAGSNTITAIATDQYGRTAVHRITVVNAYNGQIVITITSPADGATINGDSVMVAGTVTNAVSNETGVTVNGIAAALVNGQFAVSNVPLSEGFNIITVTATDAAETAAAQYIAVIAATPVNFIKLSASPVSGVSPLTVTLKVNGSFSVSNPAITFTGPGSVEQQTSENPDEYVYKLTTVGIYYFTVQAVGPDNITYSDTIPVTVLSPAQIDTTLRAKWTALMSALTNKNITSALTFMHPLVRDKYQTIFTLLKDTMPTLVAAHEPLDIVVIDAGRSSYDLTVYEDSIRSAYRIVFERDDNGIWLVSDF